jgi:hypothetical protein
MEPQERGRARHGGIVSEGNEPDVATMEAAPAGTFRYGHSLDQWVVTTG